MVCRCVAVVCRCVAVVCSCVAAPQQVGFRVYVWSAYVGGGAGGMWCVCVWMGGWGVGVYSGLRFRVCLLCNPA